MPRTNIWAPENIAAREQWLSARPTRNPVIELMRDSFDGGDAWGSVMGWWFAIADYLTENFDGVPGSWGFQQSPFGVDKDAYEFEWLTELQPTEEQLIHAGNILERYAAQLKLAGEDY